MTQGTIEYLHDQAGNVLLDQRGNSLEAQWSPTRIAVEFYNGHGWVDITPDVLVNTLRMRRGIGGTLATERIAQTGTLAFEVRNSAGAHPLGYYSPENANVRAGWSYGAAVRLIVLDSDGVKQYRYYGRIKSIQPTAGIYGERRVKVQCVDYMNYLSTAKIKRLAVQANKTPDYLVDYVVDQLPIAPLATSYAIESTPFPYALNQEEDERTTPMTVIAKLCASVFGYFFVKGDTSGGETLTYQTRHSRMINNASAFTLDNLMTGLTTQTGAELVKNIIKVSTNPPRIDTSLTVLYSIPQEFQIAGNTTYTQTWGYKDQSGKSTRISGYNMQTPVAGTDYRFSISSGGTGADANGYVTVTVTFGANSALVQIVNNFPSSIYCNLFNLRGYGFYFYDPNIYEASDSTSIDLYSDQELTVNLPYQSDANYGKSFGDWLLNKYANKLHSTQSVKFIANRSDTFWDAAVQLDIGNRITLAETVTGVSRDFFINAIEYSVQSYDVITVTWTLEEVENYSLWILGDSTYSELGTTTILSV